jgi:hypothetical protein
MKLAATSAVSSRTQSSKSAGFSLDLKGPAGAADRAGEWTRARGRRLIITSGRLSWQ